MLPNVIERGGEPQWESADATLWWCHSLAALWAASLAEPEAFAGIERSCAPLLTAAIESIRAGKHRFLSPNAQGLLEVTEPHATWMDARVAGCAVSPRLGA